LTFTIYFNHDISIGFDNPQPMCLITGCLCTCPTLPGDFTISAMRMKPHDSPYEVTFLQRAISRLYQSWAVSILLFGWEWQNQTAHNVLSFAQNASEIQRNW